MSSSCSAPKSAKLGKAIKTIYCRTVPPKKTVQDVQSIQMILTNLKHDELKRHTFPVPQVPSLYNKWAFSPDLATSYWGIGYGSILLLRLDDGKTLDMGIFKLSMSKSFQIDGYLYAMLLCSIRMSINFEPSPGQVNDLSAMMQCPQRKGDGGRISVTPMWKTQSNKSEIQIYIYIYVIIAVICEKNTKGFNFSPDTWIFSGWHQIINWPNPQGYAAPNKDSRFGWNRSKHWPQLQQTRHRGFISILWCLESPV